MLKESVLPNKFEILQVLCILLLVNVLLLCQRCTLKNKTGMNLLLNSVLCTAAIGSACQGVVRDSAVLAFAPKVKESFQNHFDSRSC